MVFTTIDVTGETRRNAGESGTSRVADNETQYDGLAQLRAALTAEDPDQRAPAYGAVMEADEEPSAVLGQDPPTESLIEGGVIPPDRTDNQRPAAAVRKDILSVLEDIRDAVQDGGA